MTDPNRIPDTGNGAGRTDSPLCFLKSEAELEALDAQRGCCYLPMDVYVDQRTRKDHFQASPILARWSRIRRAAARLRH